MLCGEFSPRRLKTVDPSTNVIPRQQEIILSEDNGLILASTVRIYVFDTFIHHIGW